MVITEPQEVASYYRQPQVADSYLEKRFTEPLNKIEHQRQVAILNHIIKERNCHRLVEFAPGPARITAELDIERGEGGEGGEGEGGEGEEGGVSIDASSEMLERARKKMAEKGKRWTFLQGDILTLSLKKKADLVFCFRFLLHFQLEMRKKIYQQASRLLQTNGLLAFEAMNKEVVQPLRKLIGEKRYFIYDQLYTQQELIQELEEHGFRVLKLYPVLNHLWLQALCSRPFKLVGLKSTALKTISFFEQFESSQPYEWVVLCQKK